MATVNKNFKIKNGLVVEGSTATVNGQDILTTGSTEFLQDTVGAMLDGGTQTNISVTYDDATGKLSFVAENGVGDSTTSDLTEGSNLYFTDERAQDAVGNSVGTGLSYDDASGAISVTPNTYDAYGAASSAQTAAQNYADGLASNYDPAGAASSAQTAAQNYADGLASNYDAAGTGAYEAGLVQGNLDTHTNASSGVHGITGSVVGTSDIQTLTNKTIGDALTFNDGSNSSTINVLGNDLSIEADNDLTLVTNTGNIVLNPDGHSYLVSVSEGNKIASQSYVDNAVSGLDWKQAVNVLAVANVPLTGSTPLSIDSHTLSDGYRVLLTAQSTNSENGIYNLAISGGSYTLTRSTDADAYGELVGAAVFVMEGTTYNNTSWVQANHYLTDFTTQDWTQFSGSGSVVAGTGITVDGLEVSVDRTTVDTWYDAAGAATTAQSNAEGYAETLVDNVLDGTTDFTALDINSVSRQIATTTGNIVTAAATTAVSWAKADYRSAKVLVKAKNGSHTHISELVITLDTSDNVAVNEYAITTTNGSLMDVTADIDGANVRVRVTPVHNNTEVMAHATLLV